MTGNEDLNKGDGGDGFRYYLGSKIIRTCVRMNVSGGERNQNDSVFMCLS